MNLEENTHEVNNEKEENDLPNLMDNSDDNAANTQENGSLTDSDILETADINDVSLTKSDPLADFANVHGEVIQEEAILEENEANQVDFSIILDNIQNLSEKFDGLQKEFKTKLKYDASKEEIINQLRSERNEFKEGLHFQILRPIIMDLIKVYDDLELLLNHERKQVSGDEATSKMISNLESFQDSIESILEQNGVSSYQVAIEEFDSSLQVVKEVVVAKDSKMDKKVAARLRKGFKYEDRKIRPEFVAVYKFEMPSDNDNPDDDQKLTPKEEEISDNE